MCLRVCVAGFDCDGKPDGTYADSDNCHGFIQCSNGNEYHQECPGDLVYNPTTDMCDYEENYPCKEGKKRNHSSARVLAHYYWRK